MIPWIEKDNNNFPDPALALDEPDGLLCAGSNLQPETLVKAYRSGIFPWFSDHDPLLWWSPNRRCIIEPKHIHESRSLKRFTRQQSHVIKVDTCFEAVMRACAAPRSNQRGTWITEDMMTAYCHLGALGIAHSIELFIDNRLTGGLYGVTEGRVFFAESMFSHSPNASKILLVWLARQLEKGAFDMIDCQVENPHLLSMGARIIERPAYLQRLARAINNKPLSAPWP